MKVASEIPGVEVRPEDGKLVANVLYTEYELTPHAQRPHSRWIIDPGMLQFAMDAISALYPWEHGAPTHLLGRPIELREGAQGLHLEWD